MSLKRVFQNPDATVHFDFVDDNNYKYCQQVDCTMTLLGTIPNPEDIWIILSFHNP
jgi:hypothetical protein